jgi:dienelactone hydrolase
MPPSTTQGVMMRSRPTVGSLLFASCLILCVNSHAQDLREQFLQPIDLKPISFETETKESIGTFTSVANYVFKPPGLGPFPAVVLLHSCGGVRNAHIKQHALELLKEGYVVLVVDSFGPRGIENCGSRVLSGSAGVADAYAGLAFLATKPFVDKSRIYAVGYSWGGIVSTMLASPQSAAIVGSSLRFTATVSNYSNCSFQGKYQLVLRDSDKPFLMLMGERDQELPAATCFPLLEEMKASGRPVQWHVFPGATHSWDKPSQPDRGYVYNEKVTNEATAKMLSFFAQAR